MPMDTIKLPFPDGPDPQRIGDFIVEKRIGKGGFGVTYLASQSVPKRKVAIKVPIFPYDVTDDERKKAVARFLHEVDLLSQFKHPAIVTLHTGGQMISNPPFTDGTPYVVM